MSVIAEVRTPLPAIVLEQQKAIDAALGLAGSWEQDAAKLQATADYTRIHGTTMVADRYAMRAATLTGHATALRNALTITAQDPSTERHP